MKKRVGLFVFMFLIAGSTAWAGGCPMSGHSPAGQSTSEASTASQGEVIDANNTLCPMKGMPVGGKGFAADRGKHDGMSCPMCADSSSTKREANVSKTDSEAPGQEREHTGHAH